MHFRLPKRSDAGNRSKWEGFDEVRILRNILTWGDELGIKAVSETAGSKVHRLVEFWAHRLDNSQYVQYMRAETRKAARMIQE